MKLLREHMNINEKFTEDSDPVEDLGIGVRKKIIKFVQELGYVTDDDSWLLAICIANDKAEWVKYLLDTGVDINMYITYALRKAAASNSINSLRVLIENNVYVKKNIIASAIIRAKDIGNKEFATMLKQLKNRKPRSVNEKFTEDSDPVEDLGIGTRKKISEWLKENNEEDTDDNALVECAANGKTQWVKYLLDRGVTFKHYMSAGHSFYYAIVKGHTEIVKMLIYKAKIYKFVDIKNFVYLADKYNHPEIKKILQDYLEKYHNYMNTPIKEDLNEKFAEDSDPVKDLGIGKCQQKLEKIRKYLADAWDEGYSYIAYYNESTPEIDAKMDLIDGLKEILDEE